MTLREARLDLGLSQAKIACLMGIPLRTWESWEQGRRECPPWCLRLILKELAEIKKKQNEDAAD